MPQAKLTKRFVESLPYTTKGQTIYTDEELAGFGIIVGTKSKTYYAQREVNRKTVRVTIGKHGIFTTEQARADAKELLVRMARGENPNETKRTDLQVAMPLKEAIYEYKIRKKDLSKTTLNNIKYCEEVWFADWMNTALSEITKDMIFKRHLKIGKESGEASANIALRVLRTIYNYAMITNETLPPNPVKTLSLTKSWFKDVRRQTLIKPSQLKAWYDALMLIDNSAIRDYLCILLFTGMRKNEGLSLRWENIDFKEKTITALDTKNGKPLVIPMSDFIYNLLVGRKKRTGKSEWLFPSTGATGHLVEPKKMVAKVAEKSGVSFMLHDLRRTFITIAESLDISSYAVKQLVNHSVSGDVTAGYVVMNVDRLREPMQKITDYIVDKINAEEVRLNAPVII